MKTSQRHSFHQGVASGQGFSLVELLVSLAIGLVVTLAITTVLINSNGSQRTSTSLNDALQTGAFTSLSFDRLARSAGSGFIQAASSFGCLVNSAIAPGPTQILPPASTLPAPFERIGDMGAANGVPVRLAPVVIVDGGTDATYGQASDQLIVMAGTHGFSEVRLPAKPNSTTNASTRVESTFGISTNDLVLIASGTQSTGGTGPCMVQQVLNTAGSTVNFGNKYFAAVGVPATTNLTAFASLPTTAVVPLGAVGALPADPDPNPPQFYVYGVNAARELVRYNLLAPPGSAVETLSENVVSIQAIYATGTSTAYFPSALDEAFVPDTPAALTWNTPSGAYAAKGTAGSLLDGSFTSNGLLRGIKGVRVAMVVRSPLAEKTAVAPPSLVMFADTATPVTYTIPTAESNFRHRIIETVIPLRNL